MAGQLQESKHFDIIRLTAFEQIKQLEGAMKSSKKNVFKISNFIIGTALGIILVIAGTFAYFQINISTHSFPPANGVTGANCGETATNDFFQCFESGKNRLDCYFSWAANIKACQPRPTMAECSNHFVPHYNECMAKCFKWECNIGCSRELATLQNGCFYTLW